MKSFRLAVLSLTVALAARADEGIWLFNHPPRQILMDRYQFDASDPWLDHLRNAERTGSTHSMSAISRNSPDT